MTEPQRRESPARRRYQQMSAARAAGEAQPGRPQKGDQYELHAAALWEHRRTLKGIKSIEAKAARKRQMLPDFAAYVDGVLSGGNGAQDDVLMTVMLWRLDVGDIAGGLAIADYAMAHGLDMPQRFERDTPSVIAEQVADEALRQLDAAVDEQRANLAAELSMHLSRAEALTRDADMHDQIRAKLYKAWGYAERARGGHDTAASEHLRRALECLQRALQLNDRIGVKKDIERLEREVKNLSQGDDTPG